MKVIYLKYLQEKLKTLNHLLILLIAAYDEFRKDSHFHHLYVYLIFHNMELPHLKHSRPW